MAQRWAEIDLDAIRHNVRRVQEAIPSTTRIMAVVKADGYGHGARQTARAAISAGAWGLAVSTVEEAGEVRDLCAPHRVLILGGLTPAEMGRAAASGCALTVYSRDQVTALEAAAEQMVPVHLKIDTGMARLGCAPAEAAALARSIALSPRLRLAGTYTHFAASDSDMELTRRQLALFKAVLAALGVEPGLVHASNSGGIWRHPEAAMDLVRLGISLYGCDGPDLVPALSLRALVTHVKQVPAGATVGYGATWRAGQRACVATVAIGYEDGVHRARSNRGETLVRGRRAPVVGRVSMDSLTVEAGVAGDVRVGDVVTVIGDDGSERITAEEVAAWSGTIPNEVLTSIGNRVERNYRSE